MCGNDENIEMVDENDLEDFEDYREYFNIDDNCETEDGDPKELEF
jgi:hypothetical protein